MSTAPVVGDASVEEHFVAERVQAEAVRVERARAYETDHKCLTCVHEPVCAVVAAIKQVGAEGDVVISSCGAFRAEGPSLADLIGMAESADGGDEDLTESDEDQVKDRR